jgi:hypothetical protein
MPAIPRDIEQKGKTWLELRRILRDLQLPDDIEVYICNGVPGRHALKLRAVTVEAGRLYLWGDQHVEDES